MSYWTRRAKSAKVATNAAWGQSAAPRTLVEDIGVADDRHASDPGPSFLSATFQTASFWLRGSPRRDLLQSHVPMESAVEPRFFRRCRPKCVPCPL